MPRRGRAYGRPDCHAVVFRGCHFVDFEMCPLCDLIAEPSVHITRLVETSDGALASCTTWLLIFYQIIIYNFVFQTTNHAPQHAHGALWLSSALHSEISQPWTHSFKTLSTHWSGQHSRSHLRPSSTSETCHKHPFYAWPMQHPRAGIYHTFISTAFAPDHDHRSRH